MESKFTGSILGFIFAEQGNTVQSKIKMGTRETLSPILKNYTKKSQFKRLK